MCWCRIRLDDEILALKTKMMKVRESGREKTAEGESDAAERAEYKSLKKQIDALEVRACALVQHLPPCLLN
eukprot:SAG22_NODE_1387_length_4524_cov_2.915028_2_plen_71_part_00